MLALALLVALWPLTAQADRCGRPATDIHQVQGAGWQSPLVGERVTVEGILTRDARHEGGFDGFYLQQADAEADGDPATSEALFIYTNRQTGRVGQRLRITGTIKEYHGLTEMVSVQNLLVCGEGRMPKPVAVSLPWSQTPESLENMRVRFTEPLTVIDHYQLAVYGELTLAAGDQTIGTELFPPGPQAKTHSRQNQHQRIVLDDGRKVRHPKPLPWPPGGLTPDNPVRAGDRVGQLAGILDYRFGQWRLHPDTDPEFTSRNNPRPVPPPPPGQAIRVMALNLQNYFNGDGRGGGFPTDRGAETAGGFQKQKHQLATLVQQSKADILAVSELENDGYDRYSAIAELADSLGPEWQFVKTPGQDGGDAIRTALLYRSDRVNTHGQPRRLTSGRFGHSSRPPVSQRFSRAGQPVQIRVVVPHLKSKSCRNASGANQDRDDGQGCFSQRRVRETRAILAWLETLPVSEQLVGTLIAGDLNSYAREAPLQQLEGAGYHSLVHEFHPCGDSGCRQYSYRYKGERGSLDYLLASPGLRQRATSARAWNVNADEPRALTHLPARAATGPWRASDHNPVFTDLDLAD